MVLFGNQVSWHCFQGAYGSNRKRERKKKRKKKSLLQKEKQLYIISLGVFDVLQKKKNNNNIAFIHSVHHLTLKFKRVYNYNIVSEIMVN